MRIGIVSNCWKVQLDEGTGLDDLVEEAWDRGYGAIELRQGCVGRFERGADFLPDATALSVLPQRVPDVQFDVAIAVPFLSPGLSPDDPLLRTGLKAADAVSGGFRPHLRLVDTFTASPPDASADQLAQALVPWADYLTDRGGWLSLEHARQPWQLFRGVFDRLRDLLGPNGNHVRLCYDPVNLLFASDRPRPEQVTESLHAADLSMVHLKQAVGSEILSQVTDGAIDWSMQLGLLRTAGFQGPFLFEIAPDRNIWSNLDASWQYLAGLGLGSTPS